MNSSGSRVYLTPSLTSATSITYTDSKGAKYIVYKDNTSGNLYTLSNTGSRIYLTGSSSTNPSGAPVTLKDSVGTSYSVSSDSTGNRYITYTDNTGQFYYDKG